MVLYLTPICEFIRLGYLGVLARFLQTVPNGPTVQAVSQYNFKRPRFRKLDIAVAANIDFVDNRLLRFENNFFFQVMYIWRFE